MYTALLEMHTHFNKCKIQVYGVATLTVCTSHNNSMYSLHELIYGLFDLTVGGRGWIEPQPFYLAVFKKTCNCKAFYPRQSTTVQTLMVLCDSLGL